MKADSLVHGRRADAEYEKADLAAQVGYLTTVQLGYGRKEERTGPL
jgi:hypothetical protein